jgi:hypothetical protein
MRNWKEIGFHRSYAESENHSIPQRHQNLSSCMWDSGGGDGLNEESRGYKHVNLDSEVKKICHDLRGLDEKVTLHEFPPSASRYSNLQNF